ncbi:MAG: GNAT superfamily N-acetyltransferase [Candidatus Azotimanducaceae bacterium]|jgi:GNAT superfamily N-acetyltransferase
MKLLLRDFQGIEDTQRVKEFLLGRELWQSLPDYWTTGKSTVGIFHTIFDSPISHHKFWCAANGKFQAYVWLHPDLESKPISTIEGSTNAWRMLIHPGVKTTEFASGMVDAAEQQLLLLTDQRGTAEPIETVAYRSDTWLASLLTNHGYTKQEALDVYMQRSLDDQIEASVLPDDYVLRPLDVEQDISQRAGVQSDAFSGQPKPGEWALENITRFLTWYEGRDDLDLVAVSAAGEIASFAVFLIDPVTGMGELDPVGTRASHQRQGLSKAVLLSGLQYMKSKGMKQACVRTGVENAPAIRTYESVGFRVVDHLYRYTKSAT